MGALAIGHFVRPLAGLHAQVLKDLLDGLGKRLHSRKFVSVFQFILLTKIFPGVLEVGLVDTLEKREIKSSLGYLKIVIDVKRISITFSF